MGYAEICESNIEEHPTGDSSKKAQVNLFVLQL